MSQPTEKKKEEETEEFKKLFDLLTNLASNNKDPNKVISIDTDELLRSNKPLEKMVKEDPVPTRVLTIDDFLPPSVAPVTASTASTSVTAITSEQLHNPTTETNSIPIGITATSGTNTATGTNGFTVTIGIDVTQGKTYTLSTNGNKESNMSITIGMDIAPTNNPSSIQLHHVNHPGSRTLPSWNKTIQDHRVEVEESPQLKQEQAEEGSTEQQEGEVNTQEEGASADVDADADGEESSGRREFQIGEGNPLIFNYPSCKACKKSFTQFKFLKSHLKRYSVCNEWTQAMEKDNKVIPTRGIHVLVEDYLHKIITGDKPFQCKYCKNVFTNTSNHHKHYHTFVACNRMAIADFTKHIGGLIT